MKKTALKERGAGQSPVIVSSALSNDMLATLLDQSLDCVKLIGLDGTVQYMNSNGLCAMEIDDPSLVIGQDWAALWPGESRPLIADSLQRAEAGEAVRFDAFCPTAKGSPRWWDVAVSLVRGENGQVLGYLSTSRDVSEARRAREVAEIASAEMRHRLRNSYAMVSGLLSSLAKGLPEREEFAAEIGARLSALAMAQTLFLSRENAPCELSDLLPVLLDPFGHGDCPIAIDTPPGLSVGQGSADALALVLGELAVNSSKHGALGSAGRIDVVANQQDEAVEVRWIERSGRPVQAHERTGGQGLKLMRRILAAQGGTIAVEWGDNGLEATIRLPEAK